MLKLVDPEISLNHAYRLVAFSAGGDRVAFFQIGLMTVVGRPYRQSAALTTLVLLYDASHWATERCDHDRDLSRGTPVDQRVTLGSDGRPDKIS